MSKNPYERAEDLLRHYLETVWRKAGLAWENDNAREVGAIIDAITEMIDDAVRQHAENEPHLYADGSSS